MEDFIFGTLATDELRLAAVRARRAGITYHHARQPRDPRPGQAVTLDLKIGPAHICDRAWVYWTTGAEDPEGERGVAYSGQVTPMDPIDVEWDTLLWGYVLHFRATLPGQPEGTRVRFRLAAAGPGEGEVPADQGTFYAYYVTEGGLPEWAQDAIVYEIFVDRFSPGEGRAWLTPQDPGGLYGGTLRGITDHMDYLANLGVNVLWLTPIFPSPSHHGYDATDLFDVEKRLGTKEDLRRLLDAAHAREIRVLLDLVANHWSSDHPSFQAAIHEADSPYRGWYTFTHWPEEYETFFGVKSHPQINLRHPGVRQHFLDAAAHWLEFGVDGFRLDYAIGPAPDFWADFRRVTRTVRPDCWTFGEVVEPSDSQLAFQGLLDGCLDFMLLEALRQTFAFENWDMLRFVSFLDRHEAYFPAGFSRPSFLDNHDMNRILWAMQNDPRRLKLASLCQFTLAGPPVIYYGTEVGLSQARDVRQGTRGVPEEARLPMPWGEGKDQDLLAFFRDLIALRRNEACLRRGDRQTLYVDTHCLVYVRRFEGTELATALNLSPESRKIELDGRWDSIALATAAGCVLQNEPGSILLHLPPLSGAVLKP